MESKPTDDQLSPTPGQQYRCCCGNEIGLGEGGATKCDACGRDVPTESARHLLSMTLTQPLVEGAGLVTGIDASGKGIDADTPGQLIGKSLQHFEILQPIGCGGMGEVYRALDTSLQRYVAVKVIRGLSNGPLEAAAEERFLQEAVAQARVNHPNIVSIYYVGRQDDVPFFAMELIDGQDVSKWIEQGAISFHLIALVALDVVKALLITAKLGVLHADIKPKNLLAGVDGHIKLSDFGMARLDGRDVMFGGTPNYLAPEVLSGADVSIQSDMYALGVTLFEMSFQQVPISLQGSTVKDWQQTHKQASIEFPEPWPEHIPIVWMDVLMRLLAKDPMDRFESYEQLELAIRKVQPTSSIGAKIVPRIIAFAIDLTVISIAVFFVSGALALVNSVTSLGLSGNTIARLVFVTFVGLYAGYVFFRRRSVGGGLMQTRVVDAFGLLPTRGRRVAREAIRMSPVFLIGLGSIIDPLIFFNFSLSILAVFIFLIEITHLVIFGNGATLHDRLTRTRLVIDSEVPV